MPEIAILAGETSGDVHAANMVAALRRLAPDVRVWGIGGERLEAAGAEVLLHYSEIAATGLIEGLGRLPALLRARKLMNQGFVSRRPDLFVPVDFGGLNLRIAADAKKLGIPVIYFIPPKAWAWGGHRVAKVRERVRRVMTILPFENDFWLKNGVQSDYVGSPVLDHMRPKRFEREEGVVGLLPGSRVSEVRRIWPKLAGAARCMAAGRKMKFLLARAEGLPAGLPDLLPLRGLHYEVIEADAQEVMERASICLVASGTATLECAIAGAPMVIVYNVNPLTAAVGKRVINVKYLGLPNLMAGREIVPELLQEEGEAVAARALEILDSADARREMAAELAKVREALGEPGASERAARIVLGQLGGGL